MLGVIVQVVTDEGVIGIGETPLQDVKHSVSVPIAGHESCWTMYEALNVLKVNAVDYIHIDARFDAGYTHISVWALPRQREFNVSGTLTLRPQGLE